MQVIFVYMSSLEYKMNFVRWTNKACLPTNLEKPLQRVQPAVYCILKKVQGRFD